MEKLVRFTVRSFFYVVTYVREHFASVLEILKASGSSRGGVFAYGLHATLYPNKCDATDNHQDGKIAFATLMYALNTVGWRRTGAKKLQQ